MTKFTFLTCLLLVSITSFTQTLTKKGTVNACDESKTQLSPDGKNRFTAYPALSYQKVGLIAIYSGSTSI